MAKGKVKEAKSKDDVGPQSEGVPGFTLKFGFSSIALALAILVYQNAWPFYSSLKEQRMVTDNFVPVACHEDSYKPESTDFPRCIPKVRCGRFASDSVFGSNEADHLLTIVKRAMSLTKGGAGGATIFDISSGALSHGENFVNIWKIPRASEILTEHDFDFIRKLQSQVKTKISQLFGVSVDSLHLTKPCFFSRLTSTPAVTLNDEYWHRHVDRETYGKFIYTALIYLSDHNLDFEGGRFVFLDENTNVTVAPRKGLFSAFTSGAENPHLVEKVTRGVRYAMTIAFACDPKAAISPPKWQGKKD